MIEKTISGAAQKIIHEYLHFTNGASTDAEEGAEGHVDISIPYYNNRRGQLKGGLRALIGKGSIEDIRDEVTLLGLKQKVAVEKMSASAFKEFLVKHNIGIDCSGLVYYVLDTESKARGKGALRTHLSFPFAKNIVRKFICKLRPAENTGVTTFANDSNSALVSLPEIQVGDFITMTHSAPENKSYDHVIVIHQIDYLDNTPSVLHYTHSIAWPTDGEYNHGVRQGTIQIIDIKKPVTEQVWLENEKISAENFTHMRAVKADKTEIRRLKWF